MDHPIKLSKVNEFITCPVCHGYLIDATTVSECLHTFCKSCIVKHVKNNNNQCPKCDTVIHERRPLDYILHDRGKQDLVYKLVPQLYISELLEKAAIQDFQDIDDLSRKVLKKKCIHVVLVLQQRKATTFVTPDPTSETQEPDANFNKSTYSPIHLKCPINVRVRQIRKLIVVKFQLEPNDTVTILYKGDIVSDSDQVSNLAQSLSFILHYEISRLYPTLDQASTSSSTMSHDSDKISIDEIK